VPDRLILPTRNVLNVVSHDDQRMVKWFEDASTLTNALAEGASVSGGFLIDDGTASGDGGFLFDDGGA
jgi:hypothetical protein